MHEKQIYDMDMHSVVKMITIDMWKIKKKKHAYQ